MRRPDPQEQPVTTGHLGGEPVVAHLSMDPRIDTLEVVAFGQVWDGQPASHILTLPESAQVGFLLDADPGDGGVVVGFAVRGPATLDVHALDGADVWDGPRFDVPALALRSASVGEIVLAYQARFAPGEPTVDVTDFYAAIAAAATDPEAAAAHWRRSLEAGSMKAHYGLGYTLLELGRPHEAYTHLRYYTELTPHNAWAWCWLGQATFAMDDWEEGTSHLERALREETEPDETCARELLDDLAEGGDGRL